MGSIVRSNSALLQTALDHWHRLRGGRRLPLRGDFDPAEVPALLPYVIVADVLRDPPDFQFRLLGTAIDRVFGGNFRGKRYSELKHTQPGSAIWDEYCRVAAEATPHCATVGYFGADHAVHRAEQVLMPFSDTGESVDMLLAVVAVKLRPTPVAIPEPRRRAAAAPRA